MSEIKFRPVRGKAETIKNLDYTDGYVYFTTDTGKIYLDVNDKRVAMGGNSGIFYGTMTPPEGADTDQVDFIFSFDEIEGDQVPNPDDLILNSDGCFYRVTNVIEDENTIETIKLTIAGSGTGGVVGPGGTTSRLTIKDIDNTLTKYFTTDVESAKLRFSVTSNITEDNFITSITYTIGNLDIVPDTEPKDFGIIEFDLTKYIPKMSTTVSTSVSIQVEDNYGTKKTINYRINVIELTLASSISDAILYTSTKQYDYYCTPRGGTTLQNRKLIFTIYDELGTELDQQTTNVSSTSEVKKTLDFSERAHGIYQFSVQYVGETVDGLLIKSNILSYRLINYDAEVNTLLLTVAQPARTVEQYSVLEIPYMVADDPQSAVGENIVVLKLNGKETQQVIKNNVVQNWRLFFDTVGNYELSISVGSTEVVLDTITVVKYQGDMPTIDEEDENLMLLLKTTNRSNNDVNRDE